MGTGRRDDQPLPVKNEHPYVQGLIHDDIATGAIGRMNLIPIAERLQESLEKRRALGEERYKVPGLQPFNGRNMLRDFFEEVIDACVYGKAFAIETGDESDAECYANILAEAMYLQSRVMQNDSTLNVLDWHDDA